MNQVRPTPASSTEPAPYAASGLPGQVSKHGCTLKMYYACLHYLRAFHSPYILLHVFCNCFVCSEHCVVQSSTLVDMLHRIDELDVIPQLQVIGYSFLMSQ